MCLLFLLSVAAFDEPQLVPVYKFYSTTKAEHLYVTDPDERDELKRDEGYKYSGVLGWVSSAEVTGTQPLRRWRHRESKLHYHLFKVNNREVARLLDVDESFTAHTWKTRADGRVPVWATCRPDQTDLILWTDRKAMEKHSRRYLEQKAVTRLQHDGRRFRPFNQDGRKLGPMFYVYPTKDSAERALQRKER